MLGRIWALAILAVTLGIASAAAALPPLDVPQLRKQLGPDPEGVRRTVLPYTEPNADAAREDVKAALRLVAISFAMQGDYTSAIAYGERSFAAAKADGDTRQMGMAKSNLGGFYGRVGNLRAAVSALREGASFAQKVNDVDTWASALGNLSNIMVDYGNDDAALALSLEYEAVLRRNGRDIAPVALIGRAEIHHRLGQNDLAEEVIGQAQRSFSPNDFVHQAGVAYVRALIREARHRPGDASAEAGRCIDMLAKAGVEKIQAFDCIAVQARSAAKQGEHDTARRHLSTMLDLFAEIPQEPGALRDIRGLQIAQTKATLARMEGRIGDAYGAYDEVIALERRISRHREESSIALGVAQFDADAKALQISLLEQTNAALALRAHQRDMLTAGAGLSLLLVLVALTLAVRGARTQRRLNVALQEIAAHKETALIETQHRAKNNLQLISSFLSLELAALRRAPTSGEPIDPERVIRQLRNRIGAMAQVQSRLTNASDGESVDLADFLQALCAEIEETFADTGRPTIELSAPSVEVPARYAVLLGLMVAEMLSNVQKHTRATRVSIRVDGSSDSDRLQLSVLDNGGVGDGPASGEPGLGFTIIGDLAEQLGGRADFAATSDGARWTADLRSPQSKSLPMSALR